MFGMCVIDELAQPVARFNSPLRCFQVGSTGGEMRRRYASSLGTYSTLLQSKRDVATLHTLISAIEDDGGKEFLWNITSMDVN